VAHIVSYLRVYACLGGGGMGQMQPCCLKKTAKRVDCMPYPMVANSIGRHSEIMQFRNCLLFFNVDTLRLRGFEPLGGRSGSIRTV